MRKSSRKPLVLLGARQVGKTYALQNLGQTHFENVAYLNFEKTPAATSFFEKDLSPQRILKELSVFLNTPIEHGKTLLIFDEIQSAPKALTSLKYFCEDLPALHVAAAGSLLGLKLPKLGSFPVGKVEFVSVYPMTFFEFLRAQNEEGLVKLIECISTDAPLPEALHDRANDHLRDYYFVGGMPEAVADFVSHRDFASVRNIQNAILTSYQLDVSKHAIGRDIQKIFTVWDSLPSQLARENKKFSYSHLGQGARAREYENAIQWLIDAGLVLKCARVSAGRLPLSAYQDDSAFKLFALDVGLLGAQAKLSASSLLHGEGVFSEFKGAFVENFVTQSLCAKGITPFYWHSEGKAEIDFLIESHGRVFPVDAKAGINLKSRSLHVFMEKYNPPCGVRMSLRNFERNGQFLNIPLYAAENASGILA